MHAEILHDFSRARACACAQERLYSEKAFDVAVSAVSGALLRSGPHNITHNMSNNAILYVIEK